MCLLVWRCAVFEPDTTGATTAEAVATVVAAAVAVMMIAGTSIKAP